MSTTVDADELEAKVKEMYRQVAELPHGEYHFEMGRAAGRTARLPGRPARPDSRRGDRVVRRSRLLLRPGRPSPGRAGRRPGQRLGDGQLRRRHAGRSGRAGRRRRLHRRATRQGAPARRRGRPGTGRVPRGPHRGPAPRRRQLRLRHLQRRDQPLAGQGPVFAEAARVLRPGGRLAIADIVTEKQLTDAIVCNADLWASCIGGAAQQDAYREAIENAGLRVEQTRRNPYQFISDQALGASETYGVKSISVLATKPRP